MSAPGKGTVGEHMKLLRGQPSENRDRSNDLTAAPGRLLAGCDIIDGIDLLSTQQKATSRSGSM